MKGTKKPLSKDVELAKRLVLDTLRPPPKGLGPCGLKDLEDVMFVNGQFDPAIASAVAQRLIGAGIYRAPDGKYTLAAAKEGGSMRSIQKASSGALPSLDKARQLLTRCRSVQEVMRIKALAQAVASCEASEQARDEASAIVLLSKARIGEITAALAHAKVTSAGRGKGVTSVPGGNKSKSLEADGVSRKEAAECEQIAKLQKSGDLDRMLKNGARPTTAGAVALSRLDPAQRKRVLATLGDKVDVKAAIGAVKLESKRALAEEIRANPVVTPDGRYQVIVSDPPWKYDSRSEDTTHRGKNLYPEMTVPEICALPVGALAQDDCVLWLWTTNAFMRGAYQCLDAWGFKEKTILTWDKVNLGLGDWLRNVTEHCILAVRGRPTVSLTNQTTLIAEKRREHSRKPEVFYSLVEALCPGSKLEMFSRTPRDGWAAWGAETEKFGGGMAAE